MNDLNRAKIIDFLEMTFDRAEDIQHNVQPSGVVPPHNGQPSWNVLVDESPKDTQFASQQTRSDPLMSLEGKLFYML